MTPTTAWSRQRPAVPGRIEWTLVAGAHEIRSAAGLPRRVHEELAGLLDGRYGEKASELANRVAALVRGLVLAGAGGSMRLVGTAGHVLAELVGSDPPAGGSGADLFALAWPGEAHGRYQTLGESRTQHVLWGVLALPSRSGGDTPVVGPDAADVWS